MSRVGVRLSTAEILPGAPRAQSPLTARPPPSRRSLELLLASGQNNKLLYGDPPKSPRATRKFSSPPPLSLTKTSSPSRRRKLSLNIPIITGGKALDLAALSCGSNGYTSMHSAMSPFGKAALDTSKLYVSGGFTNKAADEADGTPEKPEDPSALSKQSEWPPGPRGSGSRAQRRQVPAHGSLRGPGGVCLCSGRSLGRACLSPRFQKGQVQLHPL